MIPCIQTTQRVYRGEELLTYYRLVGEKILDPVNPYPYVVRYLLSDCPDWYSDLWDRT